MIGTALYSLLSWSLRPETSPSGTSRPGQPYHWKVVVFDKPLRPLTSPPEDMDISYLPSSARLMVIGRRLETRSRRPSFCFSPAAFVGASDDMVVCGIYSAGSKEGCGLGGRES